MSYTNEHLRDFRPVFLGILREKRLVPRRVEVEVLDEEPEGAGIFEPAGVLEVLEQLADDLNYLTVYTDRPAYFQEFTEKMYQETGLIVRVFPREAFFSPLKKKGGEALVFDFEWEGTVYSGRMRPGQYYIPIHKKPWLPGENLDIAVPIGYNVVIVKRIEEKRKKPMRDRFEEAFYHS